MNLFAEFLGIRLLCASILCAAGDGSALLNVCLTGVSIQGFWSARAAGLLELALLFAHFNQIEKHFEYLLCIRPYPSDGGFGGEIDKPGMVFLLKELTISKNVLHICTFGPLFPSELCNNFVKFHKIVCQYFMEIVLSLFTDLRNINLVSTFKATDNFLLWEMVLNSGPSLAADCFTVTCFFQLY